MQRQQPVSGLRAPRRRYGVRPWLRADFLISAADGDDRPVGQKLRFLNHTAPHLQETRSPGPIAVIDHRREELAGKFCGFRRLLNRNKLHQSPVKTEIRKKSGNKSRFRLTPLYDGVINDPRPLIEFFRILQA